MPPIPDEIVTFLGWSIGRAIDIEELRIEAELHKISAEELNREQLHIDTQKIAESIRRTFRAETATILTEQFGELYLTATTDRTLNSNPVPIDKNAGITGYIYNKRKILRFRHTQREKGELTIDDSEPSQSLEEITRGGDTYRFLGVPMEILGDEYMETSGKIAGVIRLTRHKDFAPFTNYEEKALHGFSTHLGAALDASRLLIHYKHVRRTKAEAICISRRGSTDTYPIFSYANPGALKIFGLRKKEIIGLPAHELYADGEYEIVHRSLRRAIKAKEKEHGPVMSRIKRHNKLQTEHETRSVDISFRFLRDPYAKIKTNYTIAVIRDPTEYLGFVSSVGHQVRAALGATLHTLLNMEERLAGNEWWLSRLNYLIQQTRSYSSLVQNLAYMDKLLRGETFQFKPLDLVDMIKKTSEAFEHLLPERNINIKIRHEKLREDIKDEMIWGHEGLLQQAFLNIMDNAIKYSFKETEIRVTSYKAGGRLAITVSNQGIRIKDEDRDKIFNRGYRARKAEALTPDGSGLGLWLVKRIIESHGGGIECKEDVESDSFRTNFSLIFPYKPLKHSILIGG